MFDATVGDVWPPEIAAGMFGKLQLDRGLLFKRTSESGPSTYSQGVAILRARPLLVERSVPLLTRSAMLTRMLAATSKLTSSPQKAEISLSPQDGRLVEASPHVSRDGVVTRARSKTPHRRVLPGTIRAAPGTHPTCFAAHPSEAAGLNVGYRDDFPHRRSHQLTLGIFPGVTMRSPLRSLACANARLHGGLASLGLPCSA